MKILIADDHLLTRIGLKHILAKEFSEAIFGEAVNGGEVLRKAKEDNWDIIILDITMPGRDGLEALRQLKESHTKIPILVLTMHPEEQVAVRAFRSGASGFLSKNDQLTEVIKAVHQILGGKRYISSSVMDQLFLQIDKPHDKEPHELLSDREFQTLRLIASGKTITEIAKELSLSIPTVSTYRFRILQKLNLKTSAEITTYGIRNGFV